MIILNINSTSTIDLIIALTTAITAILSVFIAYKSHKTTINQKELDKEELSRKTMRLFESENKFYFSMIYLLSSLKTQRETDPRKIYTYLENYDAVNVIENYIKETNKYKKDNLQNLTTADFDELENSTNYSSSLSDEIKRLIIALSQDDNKKIEEHNKKIIELAQNISNT